jgi:hypothetical protein
MFFIVRQSGRLFLAFAFLLAGSKLASPQTPVQTLKEILAAKSLPVASTKLANLEKRIASGAQLDDPDQFAVAYYLDDGTESLNPPLFVDRFDKKSKEWQSAALPDAQAKSAELDTSCLGSILDIKASRGRLILDTHINPSAGCLLVFSPDLKLEASLYGWLVGQLGPDLLVYHRSEVHFAPVHATEIAVYDLRSKRDVTIFPPKTLTATIRQARTAQLREFYQPNQEWCRKNDDPCDPETFDSDLQGPLVTREADSAAAFLISYEQIQLVQGDVQKPSGPKDVLYVYRRLNDPAKMEFREMLWSDAKMQFGDVPLENLLRPETLQKIFAGTPAKKP